MALDPRDGAVLAMASNPTYKPSVYVGRVDPKKLAPLTVDRVAKERNYPGINRAIAGVYPPGSTFKPLTALAAISDGLLSPYEYIQCTPYAEYGLDKHRFDNWNPYTNMAMTLTTALSQSCDTYFYDVGNRYYTRGETQRQYWTRMQNWAKKFGFGERTGVDIAGAESGSCRRRPGGRRPTGVDRAWNPGDLIQMAIGQKDITVTPLQMARFYAALANGGKLVTRTSSPRWSNPATTARRPSRSRPSRRRPRPVGGRPGRARGRPRRPLRGDARRLRPRPGCSAASPSRSPARRAPPRRSSSCPAIRPGTSRIRPGGVAGGRSTGTST